MCLTRSLVRNQQITVVEVSEPASLLSAGDGGNDEDRITVGRSGTWSGRGSERDIFTPRGRGSQRREETSDTTEPVVHRRLRREKGRKRSDTRSRSARWCVTFTPRGDTRVTSGASWRGRTGRTNRRARILVLTDI